jgi:glutamine amidotransferase
VSHLIGALFNEPERLECALFPARGALTAHAPGKAIGWGLGFVQSGDVLLQKRPRAEGSEVDFFTLARGLRADALVARAGFDDEMRLDADNADPFRFRSWVFGSIGDASGFDHVRDRLLGSVPEFLRRNIRGNAPSELLFHLFLSFLHDAGLLDSHAPSPEAASRALKESVAFADRLLTAAGRASSRLALVASNGRTLVARAGGRSLRYLEIQGITDCPVCRQREDLGPGDRRVSHESLRAQVVEADSSERPRAGWTNLPAEGGLVVGPDRVVHAIP